MTVHWKNVGGGNKSWTSVLPSLDYGVLYRDVKRHRALGSRGIDFVLWDDGLSGAIYVGMFRKVGTFTVESADVLEKGHGRE